MLTIRQQSLDAMAYQARRQFVSSMRAHLRDCFPEIYGGAPSRELDPLIEEAMREAARFSLHTRQDLCRFLNLCVALGWNFARRSENRWMRTDYLENTSISRPGERLKLVWEQYLHRRRVDAHNARLRARAAGNAGD